MLRFAFLYSRSLLRLLLVLSAFLGCCPPSLGKADDEEPFLPGLRAEYRDESGHTASRIDHRLAFRWGRTAPDSRLGDGEFRVKWEGRLLVATRGDYRFHLFGSGEVELKIAGRVAVAKQMVRQGWLTSPPMTLAADYQSLELSFRRTEKDARLMVLWSGPDFGLEPIPPRALFHPREQTVRSDFERGQLLARALRCGRCHNEETAPPRGPALDRLAGNLSRQWLIHWLTTNEQERQDKSDPVSPRRMPALGLSQAQAEAIADRLLIAHETDRSSADSPRAKKVPKKTEKPSARSGERLFVSLGCLACHSWRGLGAGGWFGGGDLTHIADKRPAGFFSAWLADPARFNRDHRMPTFSLSAVERTSLALFLAEQKSTVGQAFQPDKKHPAEKPDRLIAQFRCAACHRLPESVSDKSSHSLPPLNARSNWDRACTGVADPAKHRPGYHLADKDARALRTYYAQSRSPRPDGRLLLVEQNCLACHARDGVREAIPLLPPLLSDKLTTVAKRYPDLAPLVPALTPPALNSVGDKLTDAALAESIARRGEPHRPYLRVQMPQFPLSEGDLQSLVHHLIAADRVPPRDGVPSLPLADEQRDRYALAGGRLVSSDGFGCTSCHAVGRIQPGNDTISARGPDLLQLQKRIRRPWFDRWVRNPARIVPRMEMPAVQLAVPGVLNEKLDDQLAAVWHVLNLPGFEPPSPNPIRILRHNGHESRAEPLVLTDIVRHREKTWLKPFLVGLANRHNVLFDLESGGLSRWTVGDVAHQHTKGKTWFWESAGATIFDTQIKGPDLSLVFSEREQSPQPIGQLITEADAWQTEGNGVTLQYRLKFPKPSSSGDGPSSTMLHVRRTWKPLPAKQASSASGFAQELTVMNVPSTAAVRVRLQSLDGKRSADGRTVHLNDRFASRIELMEPADAKFSADRTEVRLSPDRHGSARLVLHYLSEMPVDRFPEPARLPLTTGKGTPVEIAPGFIGERLPLSSEIMPTGLTWRPNGRLVFCSLKGQVHEAIDSDGDGTEDRLRLLADGLPAPYGVHAESDHVDISCKYALLRLFEHRTGRNLQTIASGWGYSADYHDWAVGLPRNERGEYFLGIPCQEDKRSQIAARFHGHVLRLRPRRPTADDPHLFALESVSSGHRFPMGLALDKDGELFVTDNQGNYKPFNELNHARPGAHFGFINYLERGQSQPPRTPSAIDIPHPWTRSVNGICFLRTPKELQAKLGRSVFGPLEGHLIGCEYDTRRLIRMTIQRVGDTFQGTAYPISIPTAGPQRGFLGPLVCGVSPRGELYVGGIRDSGWGAGNNVGEIVRIRVQPDKLPCGIAQVQAMSEGFTIDFFQPVDRTLAGRTESYAIHSYRREATPAYGGPDRDRRIEKVIRAVVGKDARRVTLRLPEMRPGFVYELHLKNLASCGGAFHPAEAYCTLLASTKNSKPRPQTLPRSADR